MIKNCQVCDKQFRTYPSKIKIGRGKYCSKRCSNSMTLFKKGIRSSPSTEFKKGDMPNNFKGWRLTKSRSHGKYYKQIYIPEHPFATKSGHVREHRLVVEKRIGRYLTPDEVVDHINGKTLDNRSCNLRLMTKIEHDRMNTPLNIHRRWEERRILRHARQ